MIGFLAVHGGYVRGANPEGLPPGPRGKPIRPPPVFLTNSPAPGAEGPTVVTLPGGRVITNLPTSVLPQSPSNTVRLPNRAARKFEPMGYQATSFTELARFFVELPPTNLLAAMSPAARWEMVRKQIPLDIQALDGRKVALAGFVLPLALSGGRATELLLLRTQSACCFGLMPRVNELILVTLPAPGIVPRPDTPFVAAGTLAVKWVGEGGELIAIYEMKADRLEPAAGY